MKIVLDDCVPIGLAPYIQGVEVTTAASRGWAALGDNPLLAAAGGAGFGCLVTSDRKLPFQPNFSALPIAVIVLSFVDLRLPSLLRVLEPLGTAIQRVRLNDVPRLLVVTPDRCLDPHF